jgi:hypothetical protein
MKHEEGTRLHLPPKPKTFIAIIVIILTLTTAFYSLLPAVHAAAPALTVTPSSGTVGQTVSVNGTIETTLGKFNIFFGSIEVIQNGSASGHNFTASFIVPQATYGPHNITLQDVTLNHNATQSFTVQTSYTILPLNILAPPRQMQEGAQVRIRARMFGGNSSAKYNRTITVTPPTPLSSVYSATIQLMTNQSGTAETYFYYPANFSSAGRTTNYTGTYWVQLYKNATAGGPQSWFYIGITNATSYHRLDWVNIQAMNYTKPNEWANITIAFGNKQINMIYLPALNGTVTYNWHVPANASIGTYTVKVKSLNFTGGTVKKVPDVQNFTVPGFSVQFSTVNLNMKSIGGVNVTVYQIDPFNTSKTLLAITGVTKSDGNVTYPLERGNYTVKAYWKDVDVNETALIQVQNSSSWTIICQLTRIALTVFDGKTGRALPFLVFVLNATYRTSSNILQNETEGAITNTTATCIFNNQLVTANYKVAVYRAQRLMNDSWTTLPPIPLGTKVFNFNLTCPVFNLTIHAEDAKQATLPGYPIMIYDYGGGLYANATTDTSGNVTFSAAFGQYQIRLYNIGETIMLNETLFTLVNASSLLLRSSIFNANLSVTVVGYLGQPLPNVKVELEREGVAPMEVNTDGSGTAFFGNIVGGNSYVLVYVGGNTPSATASVYVEDNTAISIGLGKYVNVLGLVIMDTSQFAALLTFIALIIVFALFIIYQRIRSKTSTTEAAEKKT